MKWNITSDGILNGCEFHEYVTELIIPDYVKSIRESAFRECRNLRTVIIPESVTSIGRFAFSQCEDLEYITIPESVTSIGRGAFEDTPWLEHQPDDFVIINQILIKYKGMNPPEELIIPEGIRMIGAGAFCGCKTLKSVRIPESVISIGKSAFCDCWALERITIPETVRHIGALAFYHTEWVRHQPNFVVVNHILVRYQPAMHVPEVMKIPEGVHVIADEVFCYAAWDDKTNTHVYPAVKKLILPEGLKVIGERSFGSCKYLEEIQFPESIEKIGYAAFCQSKLLKRMPFLAYQGKVLYRFPISHADTKLEWMFLQNAEAMIQHRNYEDAVISQELKYDLIFQMFALNIDAEGTGNYIRKHFQKMMPLFFRLEDMHLIQQIIEKLPDLMQEYIDLLIQKAIEQKKHELQVMLMNYKYQYKLFRERDWRL